MLRLPLLRLLLVVASAPLVACRPRAQAPPPELPPPPAPISPATSSLASAPVRPDDPSSAPPRAESTGVTTLPPRPQPTGDREHDALAVGIWGCRVLAQRIAPLVILHVRIGSYGDVLALTVWNEGVAQPVVRCPRDRFRDGIAEEVAPRRGR